MVNLCFGSLSARISEKGAELKSLKKGNDEYLWQGDPQVWGSSSPVLFPVLCTMKDNKYVFDSKEYNMPKHGLVRNKTFNVESVTDNSATFLLKSDSETLEHYPFEFEFRVVFTLLCKSLKVEYKVKNLTDNTMYFSVGAHEAYSTPEGIEEYDIIFPQKETLETVLLDGGLLQENTILIAKNTDFLPLYDKYFILDTLIFKNLKSRSAILKNRKTERAIRVDFPDCDYFAIWHKPSAGYICLEPWSGLPDNINTDYDITKKEGIISLEPHKEYNNAHTVNIL